MRWLIFALLLTGCPKTVYVTTCPAPPVVPVNAYQTANLPETISSAAVIKYMLTDLMLCQDTERQLRIVLTGYEGLEAKKPN